MTCCWRAVSGTRRLRLTRDVWRSFEQLADSDKGNADWQYDLSIGYVKVADVLTSAGQFEEALAAYRKSLDIVQHLADSDKDNTDWQRQVFALL